MVEISKKWFCAPRGVGGQAYDKPSHHSSLNTYLATFVVEDKSLLGCIISITNLIGKEKKKAHSKEGGGRCDCS
jgi:hypothetical protein